MTANRELPCPHCGCERPEHLIPRNYLCPACQDRAADSLGRTVRLSNGFDSTSRGLSASGITADHEDGSFCPEVASRGIAFIDSTAYQAVEGRFGGAFLRPLARPRPPAAETKPHPDELRACWEEAAAAIGQEIRFLKDGDFILIEYGESTEDACAPYAQVALDQDGYWCEIVSNGYLTGDTWPLHGDVLKAAGWDAPDLECPNWHSLRTGSQRTARDVLAGLREGRECPDTRLLSWRVGTMPPAM